MANLKLWITENRKTLLWVLLGIWLVNVLLAVFANVEYPGQLGMQFFLLVAAGRLWVMDRYEKPTT